MWVFCNPVFLCMKVMYKPVKRAGIPYSLSLLEKQEVKKSLLMDFFLRRDFYLSNSGKISLIKIGILITKKVFSSTYLFGVCSLKMHSCNPQSHHGPSRPIFSP